MRKIDWVRKLTSRKLWTSVASFVSMMILATGGTDNTATQVTAIIMAGASVVAYIIGEGLTDSSNKEQEEK
nr:MAG TPA: holin [Caudoviricetes sp.]